MVEVDVSQLQHHLSDISAITLETGNRTIGTIDSYNTLAYLEKELQRFGLTTLRQEYTDRDGKKGTNLIAELEGKSNSVVMLGAHHCSVEFGPGMNDNGTDITSLLTIAQTISSSDTQPEKTIRFVFWDGEKTGLSGSMHYFQSLASDQIHMITQYLNIDTIGTLNGKAMILDATKNSLAEKKKNC